MFVIYKYFVLQKRYTWDPMDEGAIKSCWWQNFKPQYTKHMYTWRNSKDGKPKCVHQEIWDSWQQHWNTPEWKERAQKAKQNRLSETSCPGTGPTKHTCGSRSMMTHSLKMVNY